MTRQLTNQAKKDGMESFVVGGTIIKNDKILFLRRAPHETIPGIWELPSGGVETGETLEEALCREIKEETNLIVTKILKYLDCFDYTTQKGIRRQFNFLVEVESFEIKTNPEEHDAFGWYTQDEAAYINLTEDNLKTARLAI